MKMEKDSGIFSNDEIFLADGGKEDSYLLKTTSHSKLYRIIHDGKFFIFKTCSDPGERSAAIIRREYELSLGCDHPHIAHIFLYEKHTPLGEGILMEYIEGRDLNEFLAENPSRKTRERIIGELLEAVGYLHKKGIVHNDLKPENILISRNGDSLKLIDFGLSDDDAHFIVKTPGCSPAYAAPELKENRKSDVRSDIFSLGKIMRMVMGHRYDRISSKCCQEDPHKRYRNIDSLSKIWNNRDRFRNIVLLSLPVLLILISIPFFLLQVKSRNAEMEESLMRQKTMIENQKEEIGALQSAYVAVKDSLDSVTARTDLFDRLKKERLEIFMQGFDKRFNLAYDSVLRCHNSGEMAEIGHNFINEAQKYYINFDKTVEGKDINSEIYTIFLDRMQKSSEAFQKEIRRVISSDDKKTKKDIR